MTDAMRQALLPYTGIVHRCFLQGMTVAQCAAFLSATVVRLRDFPETGLGSPAGHRAIREVLWMHEAERPEALFHLILNLDGGAIEAKRVAARLFAEEHPGFLSWVPPAYQGQVHSALHEQAR